MYDLTFEPLDSKQLRQISAVNLAFVGDAIYDLYIRHLVLTWRPGAKSYQLNELKVKCVNATTQAQIAHALLPELSAAEQAVLKRGRNAKMATVAKNASVVDYKYATGFEALLGHLHLAGDSARLDHILQFAFAWCRANVLDDQRE